jgi:tetratricopeptide (TPR) repeat protein
MRIVNAEHLIPTGKEIRKIVQRVVELCKQGRNMEAACLRANSASERIELCSLVIRHSRQARQIERAYLRRGNAYAELNRFAEAVSDFTALIQINPTVYTVRNGKIVREEFFYDAEM